MLLFNFGRLSFLLIAIYVFFPLASGYRHRRHHGGRLHRRSSNGSQQIRVTVNRTSINITTTTSNITDPKLKPVNTLSHHEGDESNWNPNKIHHLNPTEKSPSPNPVAERKLLDTAVLKPLLRGLLTRLDSYEAENHNKTFSSSTVEGREGPRHINSHNARHCVLHGLWLSTVAGAAIELVPEQQQGHVEIHTRIFELPDNPYPPLINSQWTGKGIISQESPTTLTIVFQEHIDVEKENHAKERGTQDENNINDPSLVIQLPRTAVFVGQCLVCHGSPTLQGAWVVFPATQTCTSDEGLPTFDRNDALIEQKHDSIRLATPDSMYLLSHY